MPYWKSYTHDDFFFLSTVYFFNHIYLICIGALWPPLLQMHAYWHEGIHPNCTYSHRRVCGCHTSYRGPGTRSSSTAHRGTVRSPERVRDVLRPAGGVPRLPRGGGDVDAGARGVSRTGSGRVGNGTGIGNGAEGHRERDALSLHE